MELNDKYVTIRECEIKNENVCKYLKDLSERVDILERRFWWIITLLVSNMVGIIVLLIRGLK